MRLLHVKLKHRTNKHTLKQFRPPGQCVEISPKENQIIIYFFIPFFTCFENTMSSKK